MSIAHTLTRAIATLTIGALALISTPAANADEPEILACTKIGNLPGTVQHFTLYDATGRGGACITFYGHGSCTAGYRDIEGLYNLRGWGWDNRASSLLTRNSCDVRLYDALDCPSTGAKSGWIDYSENLGSWSNRASCLTVS